jgi:hypothetical protein
MVSSSIRPTRVVTPLPRGVRVVTPPGVSDWLHSSIGGLTTCQNTNKRGERCCQPYAAETKADTLAQLEEFKASLARMAAGDVTLVDDLEAIRVRFSLFLKKFSV